MLHSAAECYRNGKVVDLSLLARTKLQFASCTASTKVMVGGVVSGVLTSQSFGICSLCGSQEQTVYASAIRLCGRGLRSRVSEGPACRIFLSESQTLSLLLLSGLCRFGAANIDTNGRPLAQAKEVLPSENLFPPRLLTIEGRRDGGNRPSPSPPEPLRSERVNIGTQDFPVKVKTWRVQKLQGCCPPGRPAPLVTVAGGVPPKAVST